MMRILILIFCFIVSANVSAKEEPLPPVSSYIQNLAMLGKWFELQDIRKSLLKKNPQDVTGLVLKGCEEMTKMQYDAVDSTLLELKEALVQLNLEEPMQSALASLTYKPLLLVVTRIKVDGKNTFLKLSDEDQRIFFNQIYSGSLPIMSEGFVPAFGILENKGLLSLEGSGVQIRHFPFVEYIEHIWHQSPDGWKQVSIIAERLLNNDPSNIAGLLLKAGYELTLIQYDDMKKTISQIEDEGKEITTKQFVKSFSKLKNELNVFLSFGSTLSDSDVKQIQESFKTGRSGGPLPFKRFLLDCEEDGLISIADLEEKKLLNQ